MSSQGLQKKQEGLRTRLSKKQENELDLKARRAGLRTGRGDAKADDQDTSAIDAEIKNVERDLADCGDEIGGLRRAIQKLTGEIAAAAEAEQRDRDEALVKDGAKHAEATAKDFEPVMPKLKKAAESMFQRCYYNGVFDFIPFQKVIDSLPPALRPMLFTEVNALHYAVIQGTTPPPQRYVPQEIRVVHSRTAADVEDELRAATNRLSGITANLHTMRVNLDDLRGKEKEELQTSIAADEKILADVRNQITGLDGELKTFTDRE